MVGALYVHGGGSLTSNGSLLRRRMLVELGYAHPYQPPDFSLRLKWMGICASAWHHTILYKREPSHSDGLADGLVGLGAMGNHGFNVT
jgi:hypothetical protein